MECLFRYTIAQRFNLEEEPRVLLVAIHSCGEGVDLPGGNHMFLVEPQRSGAEDKQVFDRLHRIGQTKDVHCYRWVTMINESNRIPRWYHTLLE